jgi:hypothetical protein
MRSVSVERKRRSWLSFALGLTMLTARLDGQAPAAARHETFSARTVNLSVGAGQDVKIDVFRWSTDDERKALMMAVKNADPKPVLEALQKAPSLGTIWTNESLGYTIRYAFAEDLANGAERVVVVTDGRLGAWSGQPWKPLRPSGAADLPYALIELRLNRSGAGEGKMSVSGRVGEDASGKTLVLSDYDAAPVLLRPVRRETEHQK